MEEKTIFQKIIDGDVPATKVYEDDKFLAFLDIAPAELGHTLLIPKESVVWMEEASDELIAEIFIKAKELMRAMKKTFDCDLIKVGVAGDEVPHLHIHLIPQESEKIDRSHRKKYDSAEQMEEYANKIKSEL